MQIDPVITLSLGIALAVLLGGGAVHKLSDLRAFLGIVENYRIAPRGLAAPIGLAVILFELVAAALLLLPGLRAVGAAAAALLFGLYAAAIALNIVRRRTAIDCGCHFGRTEKGGLSVWMLVRNGCLIVACVAAAAPAAARPLVWFDAASILMFVGGAAVFYVAFETLTSLGRFAAHTER